MSVKSVEKKENEDDVLFNICQSDVYPDHHMFSSATSSLWNHFSAPIKATCSRPLFVFVLTR